MKRKLTAIMATDVVGYSRLMEADEAGTFAALKAHRQELIDPEIAEHHGRLFKLMGDGALVEFASVVDAVACAVAIQDGMAARNEEVPEDRRIAFRIGVHLGDVMVEGDDLYGDGVNVAARLEGLAAPGGICISQQAFDQIETKLDLAYEDMGAQQVKNISRPVRAYRVRRGGATPPEPVTAKRRGWSATRIAGSAAVVALIVAGLVLGWWQPWKPDVEPASIERMAFPLPERPSIAVLAFDNLTGDPEQDYLADGISETLITSLSRVPHLFVIARNSSFTYKGKPTKVQQVAEELGVRYVLEGSLQSSGERLRINVQLIDALEGNHLWAERFDRSAKDIFDVQDEIALSVVSNLRIKLTEGEGDALARDRPQSLAVYETVLRGNGHLRQFTKTANAKARGLLLEATKQQPDYVSAWRLLAWTHWLDARFGWTESREKSFETAVRLAEKTVEMDGTDPGALTLLGSIRLFQRRHDEAVELGRKSTEIDPNNAINVGLFALTLIYAGDPEQAITRFHTAMRLSPYYEVWFLYDLALAYSLVGKYAAAVEALETSVVRKPDAIFPFIRLASYYKALGRDQEARTAVAEALRIKPDFTIGAWVKAHPFKDPETLARVIEGLRAAGLPDIRPTSRENLAVPSPDKPSIAVLPFTNMSGDPEQEYFADGMTEDLITDLAKISGLLVIARNSTFAYKGQSLDVREVARELGVRYVVEGSVRKAGGRIRINAQLIDAETGIHLWAERYDRDATDVFDLQDEVRARIVTALRVKLTPAEEDRLARQMTDNAEAYDYYIRGLRQESFFTKEGNLESLRLFERAIELDPTFAAAYGRLATAHTLAAETGWSPAPEESLETARLLAEKAVALDDDLPQAHWAVARVYSRKRLFDGDRAIASLRKAIALDPNYADGHAFLATVLYFVGRAEESLGHIETAMRLNPHFPFWYYYSLGASQFMLTRYDAAIESFEKAVERNPAWVVTRRILVAAYGHLGMIEEAEWEMEELRMLGFEPTIANWESRVQIQDPAYRARYFDGLRKAGVPE